MADNDNSGVCSYYNDYHSVTYSHYDCLKCLELSNNLQQALDEVSSLQFVNKLLIKDLEVAMSKNESM
jgi:hypothetical protein